MLENMNILTKTDENSFTLSDDAMQVAEGISSGLDVSAVLPKIIEKSFLQNILDSITFNPEITRDQFIKNTMLKSTSAEAHDYHPYKTTINCILDLLNLSGKLSKEVYDKLRDSKDKDTSKNIKNNKNNKSAKSKKPKKDDSPNSTINIGKYGILITPVSKLELSTITNIEFAKKILEDIRKDIEKDLEKEKNT